MAKKLEAYRAKRSGDRTPEPIGVSRSDRPRLFVVQKHAATRLHYDFRLELGGVLKSWAVPKGPSYDTNEKRLAVQVEDHPVAYADFEGVIPEGNYGAGSVIVWDQGRWVALEDPEEGLEKGKLLFELFGHKLRGVWTLVRIKGSGKDWLLIKHRDGWSGTRTVPEESVFSGLLLEDLASGGAAAIASLKADLEKAGAQRRKLAAKDVSLMLAETRERPFSDPAWTFELKYDGFRALAARRDGKAQVLYRRGLDATSIYPDLARAVSALPFELVLDGEIAVVDAEGRPSFQLLQKRALLTRAPDIDRSAVERPVTYFAFDLLGCEGFDLRALPLSVRKDFLRRVLPKAGPLRYVEGIDERGEELYEKVQQMKLEGLMAKRRASPYRGGRSADWLKLRVDQSGDFAVVGYTKPKGSRTGFGALHLGAWRDGKLIYAGRVGTGFDDRQLREVGALLERAQRSKPACSGSLPKGAEHHWVTPALVAEVRYKQWTEDHLLRHPAFLRFRDDKSIEECLMPTRESPADPAPPPASKPEPVERKVPFTNLDKVFWPEEGYTKGDLIEFYRAASPWLLPYLRDRPVVLTRYPDGIQGKSFFQKDAPGFVPSWVRTERIWSEQSGREIHYFICDDLETLLYVVNLGTIPLHIWSSRIQSLERPDYSILDLDPKGAPFRNVVALAKAAKDLCDEIGLPAFIKTSGATGLHVLVPLGGQCTYEQSRGLAQLLARAIETDLPEISTTIRTVAARGGRVYLDFLQNGHGKTIAGPFSARPVPGAGVSTPLRWNEVNARLDPKRFNLKSVPPRMKRIGKDPLRPVLDLRPNLPQALERLGERLRRPRRGRG
jgi:bifunctional non-homologous end joining protein LigD